MGTEGAFRYDEIMKMEIAEFQDIIKEIEIIRSLQKQEQDRIENHNRARGF